MVTSQQLINCLQSLPPFEIKAVTILNQTVQAAEPYDPLKVIEQYQAINEALEQANQVVEQTKELLNACHQIEPIPAPFPPVGF